MATGGRVDPGFNSAINCTHGYYELRQRVYANGVLHFVYQCERCGASGRSIKRDVAMQAGGSTAPAFDETLADRYWEDEQARRSAEYAAEHADRKAQYAAYLGSDGWQDRRSRRLLKDRFVCQAALAGCLTRATEVHHLTYAHVGNEPLFDLVSVCRPCHLAISVMDGRVGGERDGDVAAD